MKIAILSTDINLTSALQSAGHAVTSCNYVKELAYDQMDMLVVESDMPSHVTDTISHAQEYGIPILLLTNHFSEAQIVAALDAGATDYLIKPVRRHELLTRVEVLLRRVYPEQAASDNVNFGSYVFEKRSGRVSLSGQFIELTRKEFDLALLLFNHVDEPLSRATMLDAVWSSESDIPSRTLDTHISRVRSKLQLDPKNGFRLAPVYGFGYCLEEISK